ncbi:hypothetical protein EBN03_05725 [Nocardia stercoris]|uniref:Uncharacterized protein n=1 Tax=Nocardia stercoris TaxID=2483361 RepID=A0A3M2L9W8_9NOCA|nr:hypothetical protein EBN03_05725 [Nocardia stercoris]
MLRSLSDGGRAVPVVAFGPSDANSRQLRAELARCAPQVTLVDPPVPQHESAPAPPPAALILLDAGGSVGAATLNLVGWLAANRTRMVFALDGIHAHPQWRTTQAEAAAVLGPVAGAVRIVPVSARLAAAARTAADATLLDRSGLTALHAALVEVAGTADRQPSVTVEQVLTATRVRIEEQVQALRSGTEEARLREQRAVLLAGRDGGRAQAMSALRNQLQLARVDLLHEVGARIRALHAASRAEVERLGPSAVRDYPGQLEATVHTLAAELDEVAARRLAEIARGLTPPDAEPVAPLAARIDPPPSAGPGPEPRHRGVEDHLMVALGASAGFGLGRLVVAPLALVPTLNYASMPVTLLLGGGIAYWVVRARGQLAQQAHLRQWAADALVNVKAQLEQRVSTRLVGAESRFTDDVVRLTTARAVADQHRLAEVESQLRQMRAQQPAQLAACDRDLTVVAAALTDNAARIARGVEMS